MSRRLPKRVSTVGGVPKGPESAPGGEMRQQILKTAIRLFAQKGFRGTTTREIALAAGVNEVTIFRHFASKQELYAAILEVKSSEAGLTSWLVDLAQFAERRDDTGLFLFAARNILAHYKRDADFLALKLYSSLEGHELAQKYRELQICPLFRFLRDYIVNRQRERAFHRCNPDIAVQAFLGSVYNHAVCLHFSEVDFIKLTEEETAKEFTEVFLRGMRRAVGRKRPA
jgi:AcrR family transcriptional regulator